MKTIEIALKQIGIKEIKGEEDNPEIIKFFTEMGFDKDRFKDETAWCSAFANWVCKKANLPFSGKLNARSWLNVGCDTECPKIGDVVVFWRESISSWKGHVAFFIKETDKHIYVLGGNQNNSVSIKAYPKYRLLKYKTLN